MKERRQSTARLAPWRPDHWSLLQPTVRASHRRNGSCTMGQLSRAEPIHELLLIFDEASRPPLGKWHGTTTEKKTKSPRIHRSKREGIGNRAVALATWRLYPERSITSHRFCGSGRLFPGLETETRRAEIMTGSMVRRTLAIPNAGKGIPSRFGCQDNSRLALSG